ncbi:MAG: FGGY-family carbohydrate kinase [Treponema sp.]|jgi:sugar (pentulose or hexulose) kinase|nr:FGGY-family carbohydrate kinase [Treponema sp.]
MDVKQAVGEGKTILGIELGSTRIKAVLIDEQCAPIASGGFEWGNRLEDGIWTYHLDDVWTGLRTGFRKLADDVQSRYGIPLIRIGAIGISAMMHGYLVFDKDGKQLVSFRTWRNTITEKAAAELTGKFQFNIPQRWSVAHLYQAILNKEPHVKDISFLTTLAGYVHWKLTGRKVLGLDDASGVFPIDSTVNGYNSRMLRQFDELVSPLGFEWKIGDIIPPVLSAGENAGVLTEEGAKLLDPGGILQAGVPFCPPEGDAGTGMVATNSVAERTGNISAGTSVFAMIVLEKELSKLYPEIDMVVTPAGRPVAMVHCNNCTTDLDAWVKLFKELADLTGAKIDKAALYDALYFKALEGEDDCGGLLSYNYYAGEHLTGIEQGRPLFARLPDSNFTLANFMRAALFSTMGTLKLGMDILTEKEHVRLESLLGHGGLFKTRGVGQRLTAAALNTPVAVMESAGEGGAWGIAILAAYMLQERKTSLEQFLAEKVFEGKAGAKTAPDPKDVQGFKRFMERYVAGLNIERAAVEHLKQGDNARYGNV